MAGAESVVMASVLVEDWVGHLSSCIRKRGDVLFAELSVPHGPHGMLTLFGS